MKYQQHDPKWTQAIWVQSATPDGSHVNVKSNFGNGHEFKNCEVGNHNRFGATDRSDVIVETEEYGWLCIWFYNTDILPYKES
jgi:hypothetical protein